MTHDPHPGTRGSASDRSPLAASLGPPLTC
jgi:hypothetical protein